MGCGGGRCARQMLEEKQNQTCAHPATFPITRHNLETPNRCYSGFLQRQDATVPMRLRPHIVSLGMDERDHLNIAQMTV